MLPRNKKNCEKCNKEISLSNFNLHYSSCKGNIEETKIRVKEEWKLVNGKYKCPYCNKEYSKNGISTHIIRNHTEKGKGQNPNIGFLKETQIIWNKGLSKETNKSLENLSKTLLKKYKSGELKSGFKNKKHNKISCEKMSKSAILAFQEGRHSGWVSRKIQSYPEIYFEKVLKSKKLFEECIPEYFIKHKNNSNYFLDFYFPNKRINLEIDGSQHELEDRKISDNQRDNFLSEQNIFVFRIKWRNPKSLDGKKYLENKIKEFIELYKRK
jgi:very-short-patch-repair endonuclease